MQEQQTGLTSPTCRTPPGQSAVHPPGSSRADLLHPGFDATLLSNDTSTAIPETEDCAPSFRSPPDASRAPFPHRSPRRSSANTACGGLEPPTAGRLRRAKASSPAQHRVKKLYLQTELLSTFVAHVGSHAWVHMQVALTWRFTNCLTVTARQFVSPSASFPTRRQRRRSLSSVGSVEELSIPVDRLNFGRGYPELDLARRQATKGVCRRWHLQLYGNEEWPERSEVCSGQEALQRSDVAVDLYLFG